jgi:hypothetical protein
MEFQVVAGHRMIDVRRTIGEMPPEYTSTVVVYGGLRMIP